LNDYPLTAEELGCGPTPAVDRVAAVEGRVAALEQLDAVLVASVADLLRTEPRSNLLERVQQLEAEMAVVSELLRLVPRSRKD
jgi:hypothetical protein